VCHINGQAVFVKNALPSETCDIRILKAGPSCAWAKAETMIDSSPSRQTPDCPHFPACGGCDLRHMDYAEELRFKLGRLNDAFARIGGLGLRAETILGAAELDGYRNKAIYAVGESPDGPYTGFYRERSHIILPVLRCRIQTELADRMAMAVGRFMEECGVAAYDAHTGKGFIRHVFCRTARKTGQAMACIVSARGLGHQTQNAADFLRQNCPELTSVVLCVNKSSGNTVLAGDFYTLWGADTIEDKLCGFRFSLSPQSFFQVNPTQAEVLYAKAMEYTAAFAPKTALDLYCGAGSISLCLSRVADHVIGVDSVPEAVADAEQNAARNGVLNVEFICADAAEAAITLERQGLRPDVIVVDPPRKGLSEEALDACARLAPKGIVYVSCDPSTLARDLKRFDALGYAAEEAVAVDMFPRTRHVETIVSIQKC
ncbi:MAG: 23S rRNA (uracil(1939)-C(5))-methyltransferase RlmD, partial [Firmicutes bacterium]|nr:23S rRNA (uracil(1939)-C(5))-methyltransferase RlmD [Bacillota bacterium]